jgi:phospholipid/cholesterol/gamma-HCH transport system substrate-binding protein
MESPTATGARIRVLLFLILVTVTVLGFARALHDELMPSSADLRFRAIFGNVGGLKAGAPVRLAGLDVGRVLDLQFATREGRDAIAVTMAIRTRHAPLVRRGARVSIENLGILGDKYVELAFAEPKAASLAAGDTVTGTDPIALSGAIQKLDRAADDLVVVSAFARRVVEKTEGVKHLWERFKSSFTQE